MCQFFSAILTRDGDVRFCEDDSHEVILTRLGWPDDRPLETRGWVRVECVPPHESVRVDETSVPAWYDEDRPRYDGLVMDVAGRVDKAWKPYDAARDKARKPYNAACAEAWKTYDAACAEARKPYNAALSSMTGYVGAK